MVVEEFTFGKIKIRKIFYISFNNIIPYIRLHLTYKEWKNLLGFLNKTKSKKYLPKYKLQYSEFDMNTNYYRYSDARLLSYEWMHKLIEPITDAPSLSNKKLQKLLEKSAKRNLGWLRALKKREIKRLNKKKDDAKKNLVSKTVYLRNKHMIIKMERKQFLRFRNCCLNWKESPVSKELPISKKLPVCCFNRSKVK
jgi:hypothetical protein